LREAQVPYCKPLICHGYSLLVHFRALYIENKKHIKEKIENRIKLIIQYKKTGGAVFLRSARPAGSLGVVPPGG
jgi:hypothetical protein